MDRFHAVILAGGRATRMGGEDKCLLSLGGKPVLRHVLDRLSEQTGAVALNANGDPSRFADFGLPVLPDDLSDGLPEYSGPLAGVLAGLNWAAQSVHAPDARIVSIAGDGPFFPLDLVGRLAAASPAGIVLAAGRSTDGRITVHPTFSLWPISLRGHLRDFLIGGGRRMRDFADRQGAAIAVWDSAPSDPFSNINTPADLAEAKMMMNNGTYLNTKS